MAIREIRVNDDPILRKVCKPVKEFDEKLHILLDDMKETLELHDGVGLAAPQIGILKRIFIVEYEDEYVEAINPEIIKVSGAETTTEGCLSVPDVWHELERPAKVTIKAYDRFGNQFEKTGKGIVARAFCHEYDHLEGILFIDKADQRIK